MPFQATPLYVAKAALFRTLGHPARVRILELLRDGERSVGALQEGLGLDSGGTSQHLAALRRIGLVESRREGTSVYYRAADAAGVRTARGRTADHHPQPGRAAVAARGARDRVIVLLLAGLVVLASRRDRRGRAAERSRLGSRLQAAGALALGVAGFWALADGGTPGRVVHERARRPTSASTGSPALFLGTLGLIACPALVFASAYLRARPAHGRITGLLTARSCSRSSASSARATRSRSSSSGS